MDITVYINSIDKTTSIQWRTFKIKDYINDKVNTCNFSVISYGDRTFAPTIGHSVVCYDGSTKIFSGSIVRINRRAEAGIEYYECECIDNTRDLDRKLVAQNYTNMSVEDIIKDLIDDYTTGFTYVNVECNVLVKSISFNYLPVSKCIEKLAKITNYYWYVDYEKDVHFFSQGTNPATFNLDENSGKFIWDSLQIKEDLTQLKNSVRVKGGEIIGDLKTEIFIPTSAVFNYPLINKFSSLPTVKYGATEPTAITLNVGVDYLQNEGSYDVMWNFNEKYIKATASFPYVAGHNLYISGTPLIQIVVEVKDDTSITNYDESEFFIEDLSIETKEEAYQRAYAEIQAYKDSINQATFKTYESGLLSGQLININLPTRGINEDFLIQSVNLNLRGPNDGEWSVELATLKMIGILDILQTLLLKDRYKETEDSILYKYEEDHQAMEIDTSYNKQTSASQIVDWVDGPYIPTSFSDTKRSAIWDKTSYYY